MQSLRGFRTFLSGSTAPNDSNQKPYDILNKNLFSFLSPFVLWTFLCVQITETHKTNPFFAREKYSEEMKQQIK